MRFYLHVYGALSLASIVLSLATNGLGQFCGAKARRRLHDTMLKGLLNSPIRFFETTPLGRIMNRFSTDLSIIDKVSYFYHPKGFPTDEFSNELN